MVEPLLITPFLVCRFIEGRKAVRGLFQDLFVASEAMLLLGWLSWGWVLWTLLTFWMLASWYGAYYWRISMGPEIWSYLRHPSSFIDSLHDLPIKKIGFTAVLLTSISCLGVSDRWELWLGLFIFSGLGSWIPGECVENVLYVWQRHWFRKKREKAGKYEWNFPTEKFTSLLQGYPLLRKVEGFSGVKLFDIEVKKPHVIFVFLESFRAKNVGCLGAEIKASPHFDELAKSGVLFSRFYAGGIQTYQAAIASLFGVPPYLDTQSLRSYAEIPMIGLADVLKKEGYRTALFQGASTAFDHTFPFFQSHGFETIVGKDDLEGEKTSWGVHDEVVVDRAADWLKKQGGPTFLSLFTISNHHPWIAPKGWNFPMEEKVDPLYRKFLQTFSYTDYALHKLIERLKTKGLFEQSIVFVFGDHGQEMEGKNVALRSDYYKEKNLHVPLLILGKGIDPQVIDTPSSQLDLMPTVLDLLGIEAIQHGVGRSLRRGIEKVVYFFLPGKRNSVGVIRNSMKAIDDGSVSFYNLKEDPQELNNLGNTSLAKEYVEEAHHYFREVERLFCEKKWSPPSMQNRLFELKAPVGIKDQEWSDWVKGQPAALCLDLSNSLLTDRALQALEKAEQLHEINLSNAPLFTDRALDWIGKHCGRLAVLNASYCSLMTGAGVKKLIEGCPELVFLTLKGLDDLIELPEKKGLPLRALILKECRQVRGDSLVRFVGQCPELIYLAASLENTKREELIQMATGKLYYSWFTDGKEVDDEALSEFCEKNPELDCLILEGFPKLKTFLRKRSPSLMRVKLEHCSGLNDEAFDSLARQPLQELTLINCPQITARGLAKMKVVPECHILIGDCPQIEVASIRALREQGLQIH